MARHRARRQALQLLFQWDLRRTPLDEIIRNYYESLLVSEDHPDRQEPDEFASQIFRGVVADTIAIDACITRHAEHWRLERMPAVDRNLLRLAVYELLRTETPPAVVIDEALELARQFLTEDSVHFVNGVLDAVRRELHPESQAAVAAAGVLPLTRILAIESSCDETAAAVIEDETRVLSSVVASQLDVHGRYGGVVPELASREHLRSVVPVVRDAMEIAGIGWDDLDAVAATSGPGLAGCLLVGLTYAKSIAFATGRPLIAVNHIDGHIHAVILEARQQGNPVEFPALALIVSGGHTHLFEAREDATYRLLGRTRDDAAGEAFDKVAKLLGFGYPGGPVVDLLAPFGNPRAIKFTIAKMKGNVLDFSFSGLKTAVLRWVESHDLAAEIETRKKLIRDHKPSLEEWLAITPRQTLDLLASFQFTVVDELIRHALYAAERTDGVKSLIISGGVACNSGLRAAATQAEIGLPVFFPTARLSTDNAVMIAAAAFPKFKRGEFAPLSTAAEPNLSLT